MTAGRPTSAAEARRALPSALPKGTLSVAMGLVVAGVTQYAFLAIAARALGPDRYAPLATFWSLLFVLGPGFFVPLEQEVGRGVAARRAAGLGGRPLVARAAVIGAAIAVCLMAGIVAASAPLDSRVFDGQESLVVALVAGLAVYAGHFLVRGTLSGNGRFGRYGFMLGSEGMLRLALCGVVALLGVKQAGWFGLSLALGSMAAIGLTVAGCRGLLRPGPPARWSDVSSALGFLLMGSFFVQFLLSIGPVAVQVLATPAQHGAAGRFLTTRVIAFIPVFLMQAVQAALLPRVAALAAERRRAALGKLVLRLLALAAAVGAAATIATATLGPWASRILFGGGYEMGRTDFALLSASCAVFMVAQLLITTLVALAGYARAALAWGAAVVVFVVVTALGSQLFLRVELGLLSGALTAAIGTALLLRPLLHARHSIWATVGGQSAGDDPEPQR